MACPMRSCVTSAFILKAATKLRRHYHQTNNCQTDMITTYSCILSHDQDTVHAEKVCVEMCDFYMAALMFRTGHGIKARTHANAEIVHFPTWCTIRTWRALGLWPRASQARIMHLIGKCQISAWAWFFAI